MNAINKTVEAIANGENRILLVMATGTGKTYTAFQIIWRLWKAGIKKRILFLADRTALISQTFTNDFAPFKDKMTWVTKQNFDTAHEIYLALYQGLTGEDDDANSLFEQFSPGFFDLIVVDEEGTQPIGMWGRKHLRYIKENRPVLHTTLLLGGKLNSYLAEIDNRAAEMFERLMKQLTEQEGITEHLKAQDQMAWVGAMNSIRNQAEEIINAEIIYT